MSLLTQHTIQMCGIQLHMMYPAHFSGTTVVETENWSPFTFTYFKFFFFLLVHHLLSLNADCHVNLIAAYHCVFHQKQCFVLSICLNCNIHFCHVPHVLYSEEPSNYMQELLLIPASLIFQHVLVSIIRELTCLFLVH